MTQKIPHWLTKQADVNPNHIALEFVDGHSYTFAELKQLSEIFARKLANIGVKKGTKIAILSANSLDMVLAIHAASFLNAVIILLNIRLTEHELRYQLEHAEAELLITTQALLSEKALDFTPTYLFSDIHAQKEKKVALANEIALDDAFTMMFTSGTTGKPKAVVHTYGNHWWSALSSALNLGVHKDDKWLLVLPLFHVGGLSILFRSVIYGMTVFFLEKYDRKHLAIVMQQNDITIASLVTIMLRDLLAELGVKPFPKRVRCILLGGGGVPAPLLKEVAAKKVPLFLSYGMTETSSQIVTLSKAYIHEKLGSAGKPLLTASVKIVNADEDGIGEIAVKGPMVFHGYYKQPEVNKQVFTDGWFHTGDLGYLDEDGFLYVVDRRKDLIISGGENIYPSEIENVLLAHPKVLDVAVVAKRDERWGQVPVAFVVAKETVKETELITFAEQSLARFKIPKQIIFTDSLPRNAANKIMRYQLQLELEDDV